MISMISGGSPSSRRQRHAVLDMRGDRQARQSRRQPVVRVLHVELVLDEIVRPVQLADVVIVSADPRQQLVGADGLGRRSRRYFP